MRNFLSRLLLLGIFTGCDGSTGPVMCTKMTLNEGAYFESTVGIEDNSMLIGAPERAGTYIVTVARSGYHTWIQTDVVVTADECHVQTVSLRAELEPI